MMNGEGDRNKYEQGANISQPNFVALKSIDQHEKIGSVNQTSQCILVVFDNRIRDIFWDDMISEVKSNSL